MFLTSSLGELMEDQICPTIAWNPGSQTVTFNIIYILYKYINYITCYSLWPSVLCNYWTDLVLHFFIYIYIFGNLSLAVFFFSVRQLTLQLKNHPSKTNKLSGTLLEKQELTYKLCFSMDPHKWMCQCWLMSKYFFVSSPSRHMM